MNEKNRRFSLIFQALTLRQNLTLKEKCDIEYHMSMVAQSEEEVFENLLDHVVWNTATRDDEAVIRHLASCKALDEVYGLDEAVLFDYLFNFMDEEGIMTILSGLKPEKGSVKREMLTPFQIVLLYLMKCVKGIRGMNGCEDLLFTNEFAMRLARFNGRVVQGGICERGRSKGQRGLADIRGVIGNDTLANNIVKYRVEEVAKRYNQLIRKLAAVGFFPKKVHATLDSTEIETTAAFEGCGMVRKEHAVDKRGRHTEKKEVSVYGFKLWSVYVPGVEIPIALSMDTIERPDNEHAQRVVEQARKNLGEHATLTSLAIDRGFLDGVFLWWLHQEGIRFYIPSKSNLNIYTDALSLAETLPVVKREKKVSRGYGKARTTEIQITELKTIADLGCEWFGPLGSGSHTHAKDFVPNTLHGILIERNDAYAHGKSTKKPLFLTNHPIKNPFEVYDRYDDRSLIENELHRAAKQAWFIEHPPKKTAKAVYLHIYFVIMAMAITSAFRQRQEAEDPLCADNGMERYRRKLKAANQDKLAIFVDDKYGIFIAYEPFVVMDIAVKHAQLIGASKEVILEKYAARAKTAAET